MGLAYAETHPERVSELVLRGIFTLRRSELDFYYNGGARQVFPERYAEFLAPLEPGNGVRATHDFVRTLSPRLRDDRPLSPDIESLADAIRDGSLVAAVETEVGELA